MSSKSIPVTVVCEQIHKAIVRDMWWTQWQMGQILLWVY